MARKKADAKQQAFKKAYSKWIEKILKKQEKELGLNGAEIATKMNGGNRHTYYLIRNGTIAPSVDTLCRLGKAVEVEFSIQAKNEKGEIISEFIINNLDN